MSCLGPNYNPRPPREWYRFQNQCAYSNATINFQNGGAYRLDVLKKGNVLQYKKNSSNITKQQRYAQIVRGMWTNRTTTWATQTQTYTNPNIGSLKRVGYYNINAQNTEPLVNLTGRGQNAVNNGAFFSFQQTYEPLTCPERFGLQTYNSLPSNDGLNVQGKDFTPLVPEISAPKRSTEEEIRLPQVVPSVGKSTSDVLIDAVPSADPNIIPDGGTLVCNISENICTGEVYKTTSNQSCFPTSDSDVPGKIISLCYNDGLPTYYPRQRRTFSAGGNKWPENEKLLFSANAIRPHAGLAALLALK